MLASLPGCELEPRVAAERACHLVDGRLQRAEPAPVAFLLDDGEDQPFGRLGFDRLVGLHGEAAQSVAWNAHGRGGSCGALS